MRAIPLTAHVATALIVLVSIPVVTRLAPPSALGAFVLLGGLLAAAAPGRARRLDLVGATATWGMIALMFGLSGVGLVALGQGFVASLVILTRRLLSPTPALVLVTMAAAMLAACGAAPLGALLGPAWEAAAPVLVILAIGAPGVMLQHVAAGMCDPDRAAHERLLALGPLLVGLAVGGGLGGMHGVAAALAIGALGGPLALLLAPGPNSLRRTAAAFRALGILAAGFVGCTAIVVALRFADGRAAAIAPAIGLGLIAGIVTLRVHAPAATAQLATFRLLPRAATPVADPAEAGN